MVSILQPQLGSYVQSAKGEIVRKTLIAVALAGSIGAFATVYAAEEAVAEKIELKDGSTLYLHPDGTSRMVDVHGKKIEMRDGVEMQLADGRMIIMENKKVWVSWGPPGKGGTVQKTD
jgi:hypothetical protein